ncbi:hypothetical protein D3C71_1558450 [compost metagenome]
MEKDIKTIFIILYKYWTIFVKLQMIFGSDGQRFFMTLPSRQPNVLKKDTAGLSMAMKTKVHAWYLKSSIS